MSTGSDIEWTDTTWNPVVGCTPVSPGCLNCYAATFAARNLHGNYVGLTVRKADKLRDGEKAKTRAVFNGTIRMLEEKLTEPLHWRKPRRVFVNSMSDLFHEGVPFEFIDKVFAVMAMTPQHTYQILTKRPDRMAEYISSFDGDFYRGIAEIDGEDGGYRIGAAAAQLLDGDWIWGKGKRCRRKIEEFIADSHADASGMSDFEESEDGSDSYECKPVLWPLRNVWLGCSPVNQKTYDEYRKHMERVRAVTRFLSLEPLLDEIDLGLPRPPGEWIDLGNGDQAFDSSGPFIDWIIVGGESGPGARPCNVEWIRGIVGQCKAAGVPVFVKQIGAFPTMDLKAWQALSDAGPAPLLSAKALDRIPAGRVRLATSDTKGGDMPTWSKSLEDLSVRDFPRATVHA